MNLSFTLRAQREYFHIRDHIDDEWGQAAALAFEQKANELFDIMERFPRIGRSVDEERSIRGVQLTQHIRVYYRLTDQQLIVLTLFDVRQDPTRISI